MFSFNKGLVIAFFENNLKVTLLTLILFSLTMAINLAPALFVLVVSILLSGSATAMSLIVLWRGLKEGNKFNVYDFFRIPRPEERGAPKAGPVLKEVKANESN